MNFDWRYKAELVEVIDGDTFDFRVDLGFGTYKNVRVRLNNVDTAEIYGVEKDSDEYRRGKEHEQFVREWFDDADEIKIITYKDEKGKYGRYIADVVDESGTVLSAKLIQEYPDVSSVR